MLFESNSVLNFYSESGRNNKKTVLQEVKKDGLALQYAPLTLKNNKKIVLQAVKNQGYVLQFSSPTIKVPKRLTVYILNGFWLTTEPNNIIKPVSRKPFNYF